MRRLILAAGITLAASGAAIAQTGAEPSQLSLSLEEAVERGLAASHRLAEAAARGEAAEAVVAQRHATSLPQVAGRASYVRTNHVTPFGTPIPGVGVQILYPDVPDNYQTRLDLQWPIYSGGRADALERAARAEADATGGDLDTARADLRLEITRAYWALVTATEAQAVVDRAVDRVNAHLSDVRNQLSAGLIPPNDVLSVEAQGSHQRMLSVQAHAQRDSSEAQLAYLIGAAQGTAITTSSALEAPPPSGEPPEGLLDAARQQRSERAALASRLQAAGERTKAAQAGRKPTLNVMGGLDYARPNPKIFPRHDAWQDSWDAGVGVNWPLFDGGRTNAEVAEAAAASRAATERLADFDRSLELELRQRSIEASSAREAIAAAEDGVRAATEARRVVSERFSAGVATSTDVLDAEVALLQAELDRTQALAAARLADARLARAQGK